MSPADRSPYTPEPDAEPFRCEVSRAGAAATVRAVGALDVASVPVLDDQLAELRNAGFRRLIIDLRGLHFMDSTGLHCILKYDALARNDGFSIELIRGSRAVQRVFDVTGTAAQLPFADA
jgi:anti-sigma B factor antagonist